MNGYIVVLNFAVRPCYLGRYREGWATTFDKSRAARFTQYEAAQEMLRKWNGENGGVVSDREPQTTFFFQC